MNIFLKIKRILCITVPLNFTTNENGYISRKLTYLDKLNNPIQEFKNLSQYFDIFPQKVHQAKLVLQASPPNIKNTSNSSSTQSIPDYRRGKKEKGGILSMNKNNFERNT